MVLHQQLLEGSRASKCWQLVSCLHALPSDDIFSVEQRRCLAHPSICAAQHVTLQLPLLTGGDVLTSFSAIITGAS